jgi:hypothetical protein
MKVVYELRRQLAEDPDHVVQVQTLTLNKDKPLLGLRGACGLFGSEEWWTNIEKGKLKTKMVSGIISELVFAGQDSRLGKSSDSFKLGRRSSGISANEHRGPGEGRPKAFLRWRES